MSAPITATTSDEEIQKIANRIAWQSGIAALTPLCVALFETQRRVAVLEQKLAAVEEAK